MGNHWLPILDAVLLFLNAFFNFYVIYNVSVLYLAAAASQLRLIATNE